MLTLGPASRRVGVVTLAVGVEDIEKRVGEERARIEAEYREVLKNSSLSSRYECRQDVVLSPLISVPLDTPASAIGPFVREATAALFVAFGGFEPGDEVTEKLTHELLVRAQRAG